MIRYVQEVSPATAMTYSKDGKRFTVGHRNGYVQIWEGMTLFIINWIYDCLRSDNENLMSRPSISGEEDY